VEVDILAEIAQYGIAGMMGMLWILERRHSMQRERELTDTHQRLMSQREELSELIKVVQDNSVALTVLENSQARLVQICEQIAAQLTRAVA